MKTTMIYLRQLLALCVVMVAFAACGDDEKNEGGSSSASGIQLNTIDKITCLSEGSTIDINFTAGSDWTAASSATWLKLNKLTGSAGDITLTATIHENESFDIRPATITIKDKSTGKEATISVKQASKGTILFFSSASQNGQTFDNIQISDDSKAFVATVNVTSNYDWTVNTDKSWLSYSKAADANEDGSYTLALGCTDMGTGCDTIMAQIAADCLETPMENIVVFSVDTDISPYDSGSYASATTYTTGMAVMKACKELRGKICEVGAQMLGTDVDKVAFDGSYVFVDEDEEEEKKVSLEQVALKGTFFNNIELQVVKQHSSPLSPPPFMVGMAEVEVDTETGEVDVLDYVAVVDCGTPINPNLARVQTEGGIAQGIGMALFEDVQYTDKGKIRNNSFMQYKIPTRMDIGKIRVDFESSYEESGPFGAKSIGELVIDTPCPALAEAIYNATGVRVRELPITPEKIAMGILKKKGTDENS